MKEKIEINGIRDSEIDSLLEKFSLKEQFDSGQLKCECCDNLLTKENLGGFILKNKKLLVVCNLTECIEFLTRQHGC